MPEPIGELRYVICSRDTGEYWTGKGWGKSEEAQVFPHKAAAEQRIPELPGSCIPIRRWLPPEPEPVEDDDA